MWTIDDCRAHIFNWNNSIFRILGSPKHLDKPGFDELIEQSKLLLHKPYLFANIIKTRCNLPLGFNIRYADMRSS